MQGIRRQARTCGQMAFDTLGRRLDPGTRTDPRMEKFIIEGGAPLSGTLVPAGNKNAALPALAATLLTAEEVVLRNVPRIRDVEAMIELLVHLGAQAEWRDENVIAISCDGISHTEVDPGLSERIRASFLLAGPLLARFGKADMPPPGGDVIGRRRLDPHLDAFRALGAEVRAERPLRAARARRAARLRLLHGRGLGDGDRERAHGRGPHAGLDGDPQRRLRAARAGPGPAADADGRAHRGDRLQPDDHPRAGGAGRRGLRDRPRPHRDRLVHRAGRLHRRRAAHPRLRGATTCA